MFILNCLTFKESSELNLILLKPAFVFLKTMEWSEEHNILFLREMAASDVFMYKKGSVDRGKVWDDIVDRLNSNQNPKFVIKEKRGMQDRWSLLLNKFKK